MELIGQSVNSEEEAYNLYNTYALRVGFGIRRDSQRLKADGSGITTKRYCCSKQGTKRSILSKNEEHIDTRSYRKKVTRVGCKAMVQFSIDRNGVWTVTRHDKIHNHPFCDLSKRHLLKSQRTVTPDQLELLKLMHSSRIKVSDVMRLLKKEVGGSPALGFTNKDAYNALAADKRKHLDGTDTNTLMGKLNQRKSEDQNFYFAFEFDEEASLTSIFWRDSMMREDYNIFGDVVVFDTTYRTNKYDMICAPFVGMNHHNKNIMLGCGFILNERIESFIWLFRTFLSSMEGKHPRTIMTDQAPSIAAAIRLVFPQAKHRLCIWHIIENSKIHIRMLRSQHGFIERFNKILMHCDTEVEFNHHWTR